MPHYIVKPVKDEDFYVDWSTITDAPSMWGTREQMLRRRVAADRLDRADATGTSSFDGLEGYDQGDFWVANIGPEPFFVSRANMRAFLASLRIEGSLARATWDESLTRPWNPDD